MEEHVKLILEEKASEVSEYFDSIGFSHTYRLINYGINFSLQHIGNIHTLTISYSARKRHWTPYSVSEWVNDTIIPLVSPLLETSLVPSRGPETSSPSIKQERFSTDNYFTEALACLNVLEPFAEDNIDFSVIYDFAQRGIQLALNDPRFTHLDSQALKKVLEQPHQTDFNAAKEYLHQCLMLCKTTEN